MRTGVEIRLSPEERKRLEAIVASGNSPQKHVWRARIVLLSADGIGTMEIRRRTGKGKPTIWRWERRFMEAGVDGLLRDATRPGRKPPLAPATVERVVAMTLDGPPGEATHWTGRAMAKAVGISLRACPKTNILIFLAFRLAMMAGQRHVSRAMPSKGRYGAAFGEPSSAAG